MLHATIPQPRASIEEAAGLPAPVETLPVINYSSIWEVNLRGESAVRTTVRALAEATLFGMKSHRIGTALRTLHACLPENRSFSEAADREVSVEPAELVHL